MNNHDKQLEIIQAVGRGELSVEEGSKKLAEIEAQQSVSPDENSNAIGKVYFTDSSEPPPVDFKKNYTQSEEVTPVGEARKLDESGSIGKKHKFDWKKIIWVLPFIVGIILVISGGTWMASSYDKSGLGWGFWLSWIPLFLGLLVMVLAWGSRQMVWLHVRIRQKPGETPQKINISLPLPLGLASWALKIGAPFLPAEYRTQSTIEGIQAIVRAISKDEPVQIMVDDEDGEKVEVFIG